MERNVIAIRERALSLCEVLEVIGHRADGGTADDVEAGALVTFSGMVRATEGRGIIDHLRYEHYEGMAQKEIGKLIGEARERWPIRRVAVFHRSGSVPVTEASVIVAVSAGHRVEAFEAARFLIDELKTKVPIWKSAPVA